MVGFIRYDQIKGRQFVYVPGQGLDHGKGAVRPERFGVRRPQAAFNAGIDPLVLEQVLLHQFLTVLQDELAAGEFLGQLREHDGLARSGGGHGQGVAVRVKRAHGVFHKAFLIGTGDHGYLPRPG